MTRWLTTLAAASALIRTMTTAAITRRMQRAPRDEEGADAANSMVDEEEPENGTVPAEEPVEAEEKQGSAGMT